MLRTRIISGVIGLVLLGIVVYSGTTVIGLSVFLLSLLGMFEFYNAISNVGYKPVRLVGYLSCLPVAFIGMHVGTKSIEDILKSSNKISLGLFVVLIVLMSFIVFFNEKFNIIDISLTVFGIFYIPFLFSFVVLTRMLDNGFYYLWFIFIGAFATDIFAYFSGRLFGKVKLLPAVSPKKTLEGSIGGMIGCVLLTFLYGIYINTIFVKNGIPEIGIYHYIILGIINGMISQIGDWAASAIKRFSKIKDFGNIMPGHGGVIDRFDSILIVAPTVYLYLSIIVLQ